MDATEIRQTLLLTVPWAFHDVVPASLRCVTCGWEGTEIKLRYVFDGEINPDDWEWAADAATEVIAAFPSPWTIDDEIIRLDYPEDVHAVAHQFCAYMREEPNSSINPQD